MEINKITQKVIGCIYKVSNTLGGGFVEKVYENALTYEIQKSGLRVQKQFPFSVKYDDIFVGDFIADLLVEEIVLIELKAVKTLEDVHNIPVPELLAGDWPSGLSFGQLLPAKG